MFSIEEFAQANDIPLEEISESRFEWLLREAEAVIRSYRPALPEHVDEWPDAAKVVAMRVVSRAFDAVDVHAGASTLNTSAGPFSMSTSFESGSTNGGVDIENGPALVLSEEAPAGTSPASKARDTTRIATTLAALGHSSTCSGKAGR